MDSTVGDQKGNNPITRTIQFFFDPSTGFPDSGEGTEDAAVVRQFVDRMRITMAPLYRFMDKIIQHRAWNKNFYETIQNLFPEEYKRVDYETAFREWQNSFKATWPNIHEEPDSEKAKLDKVKLDAIVEMLEVLLPNLDPENKALLVEWAQDNLNDFDMLFGSPLELDIEALAEYEPPMLEQGQGQEPSAPKAPNPKPSFSKDSLARHGIAAIESNMPSVASVRKLVADGLRSAR